MASHRITDHGRNRHSSARAFAAPAAQVLGAGTCACGDARACGFAGLPGDTSGRRASGSRAITHAGASSGCVGIQSAAWHGQSPGSASAAPTDLGLGSCSTNHRGKTGRAGSLCARSLRTAPGSTRQARDGALASELFSDHLAQDVLVEREVGHQGASSACSRPGAGRSSRISVSPSFALLLFPEIKARLAHPELAANIRHRCAALGLTQCVGDLLIRKSLALHGPLSPVVEDFRSSA